jgi:hypothetical protein
MRIPWRYLDKIVSPVGSRSLNGYYLSRWVVVRLFWSVKLVCFEQFDIIYTFNTKLRKQ